MSEQGQELKSKIDAIIKKTLPNFWFDVSEYKQWLGGGTYLAIKIAACNHLINGVADQRVQAVSLCLDLPDMELKTQSFGCSGGGSIYRKPNLNDPEEKYLAMKRVKIPFRTPKKEEGAVLRCVEKFCQSYKQTLIDNKDVLCHPELCDYNLVLN